MIEDVAMDVQRLNQVWWEQAQLEGDDLGCRAQLEAPPAIDPNKVFPFVASDKNTLCLK